MNDSKTYLAIDLGASSGRVIAGHWNGSTLSIEEVYRFPTPNAQIGPRLHWDFLAIHESIIEGLRRAAAQFGESVVSVGTDTWGVDYALLDQNGEMLSNPIAYRDERTASRFESLSEKLGKDRIFAATGVQFLFFNTLYQLFAEKEEKRAAYANASRMLFIPDLINYWLSGIAATERSIASTSQMLNPTSGNWEPFLLDAVGASKELLGEIVESGTQLGHLKTDVSERTGLSNCKVVTVAGHDTASAFAATPFIDARHATLSSGTWSIMGIERSTPDTSEKAFTDGFSNEIGYGKSVRFLKNICGMWLLEESRRHWASQGTEYSHAELIAMAKAETPLAHLIDPDAPEFATPGNMPQRIVDACQSATGSAPQSDSQIVRCIFDSLAAKYRIVFQTLNEFSPEPLAGLHIVGGGSQNELLNQLTADALGVPVHAGPIETTALGNLIVQLIADGQVSDLAEGRAVVRHSEATTTYHPQSTLNWAHHLP